MTAPAQLQTIPLRQECECGGTSGNVRRKAGVAIVRCAACGRYAFNASRAELGLEPATVSAVRRVARQLAKAQETSPAALDLLEAAERYLEEVSR